jgi:hypothetical protein
MGGDGRAADHEQTMARSMTRRLSMALFVSVPVCIFGIESKNG